MIKNLPALTDSQSQEVSVLDLFNSKEFLLMVFYPGDFTPVCTAQLCSYRDRFPDLSKYPVEVIGISSDSPESHKKFKEEYQIPFKLFTDKGHKLAKAIGATSKILFGAATRANILINKKGDILMKHIDGIPITHQKAKSLIEELEVLKSKGIL